MSTNFYYTVEGGEPIHIGKSTNVFGTHGISTFFGGVSHTIVELTEALSAPGVVIADEYGLNIEVADFVDRYIDGYSAGFSNYMRGWLHGAREPISYGFDPDSDADYWTDTESNALFCGKEFC